MYNPEVLISFAITMDRISTAISRNGYRSWIGGSVRASAAQAFVQKMDRRYGLSLSRGQRYRRHQKGHANYMLFLYPQADSLLLDWFILRTDGTAVDDEEHWKFAFHRQGRLIWRGYELVRLPRSQSNQAAYAKRAGADQPKPRGESLTWRMTRDQYEAWRKRVRSAVAADGRGDGAPVRQFLHSLAAVPGFRGCREQVIRLGSYFNAVRKKQGLSSHEFTNRPWYMRRRRCGGYPLTKLIDRACGSAMPEAICWFPERT